MRRDTTAHQAAVALQTDYKSSLYLPMMVGSSERALIEAVEDVYGRFGTPFLSPEAYDWKRVREALHKCPPMAIPQLHAAFLSRASHINLTREYIESELRTSEPWLAEWADHDPAPLYGTGCASRVSALDMLLTLGSLEQVYTALFEYGDAVEEYVRIAVGFVGRHPLRVLGTSSVAPAEKAVKELALIVYAGLRDIDGMELSSSPHDSSDEHDDYSNIKVRLHFGDYGCNDDDSMGDTIVWDDTDITEGGDIAVFDCEDDEFGDGSNAGGIGDDDDIADYDHDDDSDGEMDDDDYVFQNHNGSYSNIYNANWP